MMTETCHQFKLIDLSTAEIQYMHHHILNRGRCEPARTNGGNRRGHSGFSVDEARTWTGRGCEPDTDWSKIRIVRGRGLDMATDKLRSRSVRGLDTDVFADRSRTWIVCYHGQTAVSVTDWLRTWTDHGRGCGLDMDIFTDRSRTRTNCGHGYGQDAGMDWSRARMRTGHGHGHHAGQ